MNGDSKILQLLARYELGREIRQIKALGAAGGFSGAEFWRAESDSACWCIRKWPREHPSEERLRLIHSLLQHAWQAGFRHLPLPLQDQDGATFTEIDGFFWEVTPWLPGDVIPSLPAPAAELCAAMETLAEFHQALASFAGSPTGLQPSPGMIDRYRLLEKMVDTGLDRISSQLPACDHRGLMDRAAVVLDYSRRCAPELLKKLQESVGLKLQLQPCIRDIHHQHLLFQGSQVSGIIDFGAMNYDSVATDIARLLGSLALDDPQCRKQGLLAYQARRPLDVIECACVETFDQANKLLSPLNWLQWLVVEKRQFDDWALVWQRLDELIVRLTNGL